MKYQAPVNWTWKVIWSDGSELEEYPDGVHTHTWADIQKRLDAGDTVSFFMMLPYHEPLQAVVVEIREGETPIFMRRSRMPTISLDGSPLDPPYTVHVVGIRRVGEGRESMFFGYFYSDGRALLTSNPMPF